MRLSDRLGRLERAARDRGVAGQFHVVEAVPVGREAAEGRPPGLYRSGPDGSLAGLLVFDPAEGGPVVPEGKFAPWGLLIVHGSEYVEPPADWPGSEG